MDWRREYASPILSWLRSKSIVTKKFGCLVYHLLIMMRKADFSRLDESPYVVKILTTSFWWLQTLARKVISVQSCFSVWRWLNTLMYQTWPRFDLAMDECGHLSSQGKRIPIFAEWPIHQNWDERNWSSVCWYWIPVIATLTHLNTRNTQPLIRRLKYFKDLRIDLLFGSGQNDDNVRTTTFPIRSHFPLKDVRL